MKPVSDSKNISRAKLAYLIDATAAPVCMIAPISSWAAAVAGVVVSVNGLALFIKAIPYNFYSLLTIVMIITITLMKFDYGPMKRHELNAMAGDLFSEGERNEGDGTEEDSCEKGRVFDLVLPVVVLIIACVVGMIYTGGFFDGVNFVDAFANCDASVGLALGSGVAVVLTAIYLICRRVISFKDAMAALPKGFSAMVPAILILCFATYVTATIFDVLLGSVLILLSIYFLFFSKGFKLKPTPLNGCIAGTLSGVLTGLFSTGGPPIVLYLTNATASPAVYLAATQFFFSVTSLYATATRAISGILSWELLLYAAIGMIGCFLGNLAGKLVFDRLNAEKLKKTIYLAMAVSGVLMLL